MVVGVVSSLPMKGVFFLLGNNVAGGRVKASSTIPKIPMCEENPGHDDESHKVGHSENSKVRDSPKSENSKVRDNLPSRALLSESKGSCGVNEGLGKVDLNGTKTKGEQQDTWSSCRSKLFCSARCQSPVTWLESAEADFQKLKTVLLSAAHGRTAPDVKMGFQRAICNPAER